MELERSQAHSLEVEGDLVGARVFYESIAATVRESLILLDRDMKVVWASRSFYGTFKVAPEATVGYSLFELGNRQWDIPTLKRLLEEILPKENTVEAYKVSHDFPDIGPRTMLLNARMLYRPGVGPKSIFLAIEDVTERTRLEQWRRLLEEAGQALGAEPFDFETRIQKILEIAVEHLAEWCVFDIAQKGALRRCVIRHADQEISRQAAEAVSLRVSLPEGTAAADVLRTGQARHYPVLDAESLAFVGGDESHIRFLREIGAKTALLLPMRTRGKTLGVLTLVSGCGRQPLMVAELRVAQDLADRAALSLDNAELVGDLMTLNDSLEIRVRHRTEELEEAIKELENFTYSIAHDLRAPLRGMAGFADLLIAEQAPKLDPEGQEFLGRIKESASRMDRLICDLLTYSRLARSDIDLDTVDLEALLDGILEEMAQELRARKADVDVRRPLPAVRGNRVTLSQALTNLVSNAVKFVAPGVEPRVTVRAEPKEKSVRLWVEDNGIGIPCEHHDRIFGVFQRLQQEESFPGTGIGLAIVKRATERMGGAVGVESEPGKGSRFWIELPAAGGGGAGTMSRERKFVLLVGDDPNDLLFAERALKNLGVGVALRVVNDGQEAMD
jgi:signal transduction histidine kinase